MVKFDTNKSGSLTDREMQDVMTMTKLEKKICAKVWNLSNPKFEANFTKKMFLIAMHLMYKARQDSNCQLPEQVPIELDVSAAEAAGVASNAPPPCLNV